MSAEAVLAPLACAGQRLAGRFAQQGLPAPSLTRQAGGLGKVHQVFGDELETIIEDLNSVLAA